MAKVAFAALVIGSIVTEKGRPVEWVLIIIGAIVTTALAYIGYRSIK